MPHAGSSAKPSTFSVFRNRSFALMWTGQLVSTVGSALTSLAASILVFRLTGSALSVGLMLMATALPTLFVGLIAGVFVDRTDRRRMMIGADLVRATLVFLIPILIPFNIVWLYIIVALSSAVKQFFDPAYESVLPEVASDEELAAANSMIAISSFGSTAIGFAASGLIASQFNINWAFYIDAFTFLFSAACIYFVHIAPLKVEGETSVSIVVSNLRAGVGVLFGNPILRSIFFVLVMYYLSIGLWNSLLLPFAIRALHATEFEYGLQEGLTSVGFVAASFLMARFADRLRDGQWVVISFVGMMIVGVLYGLSTTVPIAIMWVIASGFFNAPYGIARRLIVQRNTPREARGRVNSVLFVTRDIVLLIGMAAAGLADVIDVRVLMIATAAILAIPALLALLLPGLGQPAAEWKRAMSLLRGVQAAPRLGIGRAATLADFDLLVGHIPAFASLSLKERQNFAARTLVADAAPGTMVVYAGEVSDNAYFILKGQAAAGLLQDMDYKIFEMLNPGDFFGEIAALTGQPRTANVITEMPTTLLQIPAPVLREMTQRPELHHVFVSKMNERVGRMAPIESPRYNSLDQESLRELRTAPAEASK